MWVDQYVADAGSMSLLVGDALVELVRRAHAGDEAAAESIVRAYRRLVVSVAKRYVRPTSPSSNGRLAELIALGEDGLRNAVDRFEPAKGFRFSTYATWYIRQAITRGMSGAAGPDADGPAGDRHPRPPLPSSGSGSVAMPLPADVT
ncbi:MAG TPA: sigma factor [Acidimicrobiales bacterium]|nr:sigma factor [Acidimicrobiales bacterium]